MADTTKKPGTGGNTPKPAPTTGGSQSAKDKSRAQSRPVSTKAPAGKGGSARAKGGNAPRPGARPAATAPAPKASRSALLTWGAVGLVVVVVAVLVIVKVVGGTTTDTTFTPVTPAPASVLHDVTNIPMSVYDTVGVTSSSIAVSPPKILSNQPPMVINGKSPAMLYYGAEYCPYCAAERWAMVAALSRFGTWSDLQITASSHTDVDPATHTFSFHGATLTSPYLTFAGIEQYTNVPNPAGPNPYTTLQNPTKAEAAILTKYSSSQFLPNSSTSGGISFPFVDINNLALFSGASYDPGALANLTWTDIASNLSDPTNPITQAIVATANYMSAAICASTKGQPANVCTSSGVKTAAKALGINAS